jgi:hypothetical protein
MADSVADDDRGASEAKEIPDDFSDAFDKAEGIGEKADVVDDPKDVEKTVDVTPEPEPVKSEEQQPGESDEKYEQRYKTLQGIHRHDKEVWESERADLLAKIQASSQPVPEPTAKEAAAVSAFIDSLTPEQQEQLKEYEQDFDVVSKMEGLKRSIELGKLQKDLDNWKAEVMEKITSQSEQFNPALKMVEEVEKEVHFSSIRTQHPDFEQYREDGSIKAWIEGKPSYLQPALKYAYAQGNSKDVVDLISDFKRESNIQTQGADNVVPITSTKAARKQALTSVTTRRGAVNTGKAIMDDYEGAFDEALNK